MLFIFASIAQAQNVQPQITKDLGQDFNSSEVKGTKLDYQLNFSTKTAGYYEGEDEASLVLFGFQPILNFKFNENFNINADVFMNLNSSRVQTRFINQWEQTFFLNELAINYSPVEVLKLTVGAINQSHLESPYLVTALSFPGAMATLQFQANDLQFGYKGQRLIPTSQSQDSDRTEKEELPIFTTQGIFANYKPSDRFNLSGQINYFQYSQLPSVVAFQSQRLGNDAIGVEIGDSRFVNEFSGFAQSLTANFQYNDLVEQRLYYSFVENENTSDGDNRAQILEAALTFKASSIDIIPSIATFYSEPNVAPAFYNTMLFGNNNREGFKYGLRTRLKNYNLEIEASYIDAKVINETVFQDDLSSLQLVMEMLNVKF